MRTLARAMLIFGLDQAAAIARTSSSTTNDSISITNTFLNSGGAPTPPLPRQGEVN